MMSLVAAQPMGRHSREGGNPVTHLTSSKQTVELIACDKGTGFPPKARGNDGDEGELA